MTPTEIRALRSRLGYSRSQMAEAAGCSPSQIVRIETGEAASETLLLAIQRHERLVDAGLEQRIPDRPKGRPKAA